MKPCNIVRAQRGLLAAVLIAAACTAGPAFAGSERADREQLHRYGSRGIPYVPLAQAGQPVSNAVITVRPFIKINLDGDPAVNAFAHVLPIDADGDGRYEFVHHNAYRTMRLYRADGTKLWQVDNPYGRAQGVKELMQRDTSAILDVDHDGKQDIVHCWAQGTDRYLVYRRGSNGQVIRLVKLPGSAGVACQIAGMRMADRPDPILLVAEKVADGSCPRNFVGYWARTTAYDLSGKLLWGRNTCDAGHQAYPLDENQDGKAEAVFVGKYLLRSDGTLQCTLQGWPAWDHADAVNVAEIDPTHPGIEAVAVGATGVAGFDAKSCKQLWRVPLSVIDNPQHMTLARVDAASPTPQVFVEEKGGSGSGTFVLNGKGQVIRKILGTMPMQNANLDNARGTDELIGSFGEALGFGATKRLTRAWFWWLKGTKVVETTAVLSPTLYGKWQAHPLIMDFDGDGRDEIVQWGQSLIVVGKAS